MTGLSSATVRGAARTVLAVPVRPQTYRNLLYLSLAFPLGLAYFLALSVGLSLGVGLSFVLVGLPLLVAVLAVAVGVADLERRLTAALLDVELEPGAPLEGDGRLDELRSLLTRRSTWTALVYLATKLFVGIAALVVLTTALTTGVALLFAPLYYSEPGVYVGVVTDRPIEFHPALYLGWDYLLVGLETVITIDAWRIDTLGQALGVAVVGVALTLLSLHLLNALARLSGWYARLMLGGCTDLVGTVRRATGD